VDDRSDNVSGISPPSYHPWEVPRGGGTGTTREMPAGYLGEPARLPGHQL